MPLPRTLAGRIVFTTVIVAVVAVLVAGAVSFGLMRTQTLNSARAAAASLAVELASLPQAQLDRHAEDDTADAGSPRIAVIRPDGAVLGSLGVRLRPAVRKRLTAGSSLSASETIGNRRYIVEARSTSGGGTVVVARSVQSVDAEFSALAGRLALALAIGLAVAVAAGILIARVVARPLARTASAARGLARGERNVDLPSAGTIEVSAVVTALGDLDHALKVSETRQREFLLSVSHDLRTPLTALRGYAEALADGMIGPDELPGVGATMVTETRRLDRFVADLLELARAEAQDYPIAIGPVGVAGLLADAAEAWRAVAASSGVELRRDASTALVASTDPHRLRQIIDGLIENALRATPSGGVVLLAARQGLTAGDDPPIVIIVSDTGPGLSAEDRDAALVRGALHEKYRTMRPVGTGLGLSIAARLAGRLGATLRATDTSGTPWGTAFELTLPSV